MISVQKNEIVRTGVVQDKFFNIYWVPGRKIKRTIRTVSSSRFKSIRNFCFKTAHFFFMPSTNFFSLVHKTKSRDLEIIYFIYSSELIYYSRIFIYFWFEILEGLFVPTSGPSLSALRLSGPLSLVSRWPRDGHGTGLPVPRIFVPGISVSKLKIKWDDFETARILGTAWDSSPMIQFRDTNPMGSESNCPSLRWPGKYTT